MLPVIAVYFYQLRKVSLSGEHIFNALAVEHKAVCGDLEALFLGHAVTQIGEE